VVPLEHKEKQVVVVLAVPRDEMITEKVLVVLEEQVHHIQEEPVVAVRLIDGIGIDLEERAVLVQVEQVEQVLDMELEEQEIREDIT